VQGFGGGLLQWVLAPLSGTLHTGAGVAWEGVCQGATTAQLGGLLLGDRLKAMMCRVLGFVQLGGGRGSDQGDAAPHSSPAPQSPPTTHSSLAPHSSPTAHSSLVPNSSPTAHSSLAPHSSPTPHFHTAGLTHSMQSAAQ